MSTVERTFSFPSAHDCLQLAHASDCAQKSNGSDVELEVDHVAVADDVLFAFDG